MSVVDTPDPGQGRKGRNEGHSTHTSTHTLSTVYRVTHNLDTTPVSSGSNSDRYRPYRERGRFSLEGRRVGRRDPGRTRRTPSAAHTQPPCLGVGTHPEDLRRLSAPSTLSSVAGRAGTSDVGPVRSRGSRRWQRTPTTPKSRPGRGSLPMTPVLSDLSNRPRDPGLCAEDGRSTGRGDSPGQWPFGEKIVATAVTLVRSEAGRASVRGCEGELRPTRGRTWRGATEGRCVSPEPGVPKGSSAQPFFVFVGVGTPPPQTPSPPSLLSPGDTSADGPQVQGRDTGVR